MLTVVIIAVLAVAAALIALRRRDTGYAVDEFAKARSLTTEWARKPAPSPQDKRASATDDRDLEL